MKKLHGLVVELGGGGNEEEGDCAAPHVVMPLAEFSDVTKTYSVSLDKETIEILTQVVNQRGVISHFSCTFPVLNSWFFSPSLEVAILIS